MVQHQTIVMGTILIDVTGTGSDGQLHEWLDTRGDWGNKDGQDNVHNLAELSSHHAVPASERWNDKLHTHHNGPATAEATEPRSVSLQKAEHWTPVQALLSMAEKMFQTGAVQCHQDRQPVTMTKQKTYIP